MKNALKALLLLSLVACNSGGGGSDSKTVPDKRPDPIPEPTSKTFDIEVERKVSFDPLTKNYSDFKTNINNHNIILRPIGGYFSEARVNCYKIGMSNNVFKSSFDSEGDLAVIEVAVDPQGPNKVEFNCDVIENDMVLETITVSIRKSIVVTGTSNITALGINKDEIETLLLDSSATLLTDGADVEIKIRDLISEKGTLGTFTKESALDTLDDMNGLPGGKIVIEAQRTFGELKVELRGKNAGKLTRQQIKNPKVHARDYSLDGKCVRVNEGTMGEETRKCSGKNGKQGEKGLTGLSGKNGGATGSLTMNVKNKHTMNLEVEYFPGKSSEGSAGGEGGVGGKGGIGSTVFVKSNPHIKMVSGPRDTYKYPDGADGATGPQGDPGARGLEGMVQDSMVTDITSGETFNWPAR